MKNPLNKRLRIRNITLEEFERESEGSFKFFRIDYIDRETRQKKRKEYQNKYNVRRILEAQCTIEPVIHVLEVVDDG